MKIAVDLDGVVFNFLDSFLKFSEEVLEKSIPREQIKHFNWADNGICTKAAESKLLHEFACRGGFLYLNLIPDARYYLYKIYNDLKHDIIFITSRHAIALADTYVLTQAHGLDFPIHFSDKENRKWKIAKNLDCSLLIDDRAKYLIEVEDNVNYIQTMLFNLNNQLEVSDDDKNKIDFYVQTWKEAYDLISEL